MAPGLGHPRCSGVRVSALPPGPQLRARALSGSLAGSGDSRGNAVSARLSEAHVQREGGTEKVGMHCGEPLWIRACKSGPHLAFLGVSTSLGFTLPASGSLVLGHWRSDGF